MSLDNHLIVEMRSHPTDLPTLQPVGWQVATPLDTGTTLATGKATYTYGESKLRIRLLARTFAVLGGCWVCLLIGGCSREQVLQFNQHADIADLPERHQANISETMLRLFGTPVNPRQRIVDADSESEEGEPTPLIDEVATDHLQYGARVYNARCAGCHGVSGDGQGPAGEFLQPRPRDYRRGIFKFTSTPYGAKPARHDLIRTIRRGAKGTSMPAFPWMSDEDLNAVIDYVMYLSRRGEVEGGVVLMAGEYFEDEDIEFYEFSDALESSADSWNNAEGQVVLPVSAEPTYEEGSVALGRKLFLSKGCSSCHGVDGKGQVEWISPEFIAKQESLPEDQREKINYDAWQEPAPAADLTARLLHGGRRPIDIYRRIHTGINGTPMPAFGDLFAEEPESIWHLVHYVLHIIEGGDPLAGIPSLPPEESSAVGEESATEDSVVEETPASIDPVPDDASSTDESEVESANAESAPTESKTETDDSSPEDAELDSSADEDPELEETPAN